MEMKAIKSFLALALAAVCALTFASLSNGSILIQTGFERDKIGEIPQEPPGAWETLGPDIEVTNSPVKEGKQSLAILAGGDRHVLGAPIDTESPVVTVEFWLYVEGQGRSLTFFLLGRERNLPETWGAAGPYVNWISGMIRYYPGEWVDIGPQTSDEWHYIRIVADTSKSVFDIYAADTVAEAHAGEPLGKDLAFRSDLGGPPAWICFGAHQMASSVYVDELLSYEGDVMNVKPEGKLASTWGKVKKQSSF